LHGEHGSETEVSENQMVRKKRS